MRTLTAVSACLLALATSAHADDLAAALAQSKAPPRFKDHTPRFTTKKMTFTMHEIDQDAWKAGEFKADPAPVKQVQQTFTVIMDGDACVALYDRNMGQLDLITTDPAKAPKTLTMPPRYHWGSMFGTRIQTVPWAYGWAPTGDVRSAEWSGGGATVTLVESQEWKNKKDGSTRGKSTHTVTLKCDPVTGYTVDLDCQYATREGNKKQPELSNIVPKGLSDVFHPQFDKLVFSADGGEPGTFVGWNNNCYIGEYTNKNHPIKIREGGMVAWLRGPREADQWGIAVTRTDISGGKPVKYFNPTCNVWLDQHNSVNLSDTRDAAGMFAARVLLHVAAVPPEASGAIAAKTRSLDFAGEKKVMIRMADESFEDQPLPVSSPVRGACVLQGDLKVTDAEAHTGKRSLEVQATEKPIGKYDFFLGAPQINLDSNARYRLSAWVKVVGDDTEAFLIGDLYDNSPHDDHRYHQQRTLSAKATDGWKQVALEFDTGNLAPQIDLKFAATGAGKAYFDDFSLTKVQPTAALK